MNKIGIIAGIIVFLAAIILYIITLNVQKSQDTKNTSSNTVSVTSTSSKEDAVSENTEMVAITTATTSKQVEITSKTESVEVVTPSSVTKVEVLQEEIVDSQVFMEIDASTLPEGKTKEEVGIVAKKGIYLVKDELYYMTEILMTDNTVLKYFVSHDGYDSISSGDKVRVKYTNYITKSGKRFNIVDNISLI